MSSEKLEFDGPKHLGPSPGLDDGPWNSLLLLWLGRHHPPVVLRTTTTGLIRTTTRATRTAKSAVRRAVEMAMQDISIAMKIAECGSQGQ